MGPCGSLRVCLGCSGRDRARVVLCGPLCDWVLKSWTIRAVFFARMLLEKRTHLKHLNLPFSFTIASKSSCRRTDSAATALFQRKSSLQNIGTRTPSIRRIYLTPIQHIKQSINWLTRTMSGSPSFSQAHFACSFSTAPLWGKKGDLIGSFKGLAAPGRGKCLFHTSSKKRQDSYVPRKH